MGWDEIRGNRTGLGVAVTLLVLAAVITVWSRSGAAPRQRYFYNLQSGDLVAHATAEAPPVTLRSGAQGVLAHVFACGDCATNKPFIGFLAKYSDEDKRAMTVEIQEQDIRGPMQVPVLLIAREPPTPGGELEWVSMQSPHGMMIVDSARARCGATAPQECVP